ncbi:MAG TPA: AlkA N-terminal domain-containing protein [Trueperaceae bacterium]|nr:AlkA N-terminal domain-containing protein [Trueperaceae bacterium]
MDLPFAEPYHAGAMLAALSSHAVLGVEVSDVEAGTHRRALRTPNGPAVLALSFGGGRVTVATEPHVTDTRWLTTTVRRWLDLDADPRVIEAALGSDPLIGPLLAVRPGLRVLGYADPFEGAITTVIGQQVSLAATRTFGGRLVAAFGTRVRDGFSVFPTAEQLAALTPLEVQRAVGITSARARTVVRLAAAFAGGLTLEAGAEPAITRAALLELPGIGPWTVDYLSVRALGDRDAFVPGDLVLRRALGVATAKEADELAEAWRPFRAYALFHLWTTAAYLPSIGSTPGRDRR